MDERLHMVMDDTNYDLNLKDAPKLSAEEERQIKDDLEHIFEECFGKKKERAIA